MAMVMPFIAVANVRKHSIRIEHTLIIIEANDAKFRQTCERYVHAEQRV